MRARLTNVCLRDSWFKESFPPKHNQRRPSSSPATVIKNKNYILGPNSAKQHQTTPTKTKNFRSIESAKPRCIGMRTHAKRRERGTLTGRNRHAKRSVVCTCLTHGQSIHSVFGEVVRQARKFP